MKPSSKFCANPLFRRIFQGSYPLNACVRAFSAFTFIFPRQYRSILPPVVMTPSKDIYRYRESLGMDVIMLPGKM